MNALVIITLLFGAVPEGETGNAGEAIPPIGPAEDGQTWFSGDSDWEPAAADAWTSAELRLEGQVRSWLQTTQGTWGSEIATCPLGDLLNDPGVPRRVAWERRVRAYGTLTRLHLRVGIGAETLTRWMDAQRAATSRQRWMLLAKLAGSVAAVGLVTITAQRLDACTRGYRRFPIGVAWAITSSLVLAVAWY